MLISSFVSAESYRLPTTQSLCASALRQRQRQRQHAAADRFTTLLHNFAANSATGAARGAKFWESLADACVVPSLAEYAPVRAVVGVLAYPVHLLGLALGAIAGAAIGCFCRLEAPAYVDAGEISSSTPPAEQSEISQASELASEDAAAGPQNSEGASRLRAEALPYEIWADVISRLPFHDKRRLQRVSKSMAEIAKSASTNSPRELAAYRSNELLIQLKESNADQSAIGDQQRLRDSLFRFEYINAKWHHHTDPSMSAALLTDYDDIASIFGPGEQFARLPILDTTAIEYLGGGTGYIDYIRSADLAHPVMRGFDRSADRPFVIFRLKVKRQRNTDQSLSSWDDATFILFQRYDDSRGWITQWQCQGKRQASNSIAWFGNLGSDAKGQLQKLASGDVISDALGQPGRLIRLDEERVARSLVQDA